MINESVLSSINQLPRQWLIAGSLSYPVLKALGDLPPAEYSMETGTGKSTLVFSHISQHHIVFTKDDRGDGDSLNHVGESEFLDRDKVEFVVGATQLTLPVYKFSKPIDIAFLDGPHGYPFPELEYLCVYPHIKAGGWLILDDCHIPTVARLVDFLKAEAMFRFVKTVRTTAFFQRTEAPTFLTTADGWWTQEYNKKHFPALRHSPIWDWPRLLAPQSMKSWLRSALSRNKPE